MKTVLHIALLLAAASLVSAVPVGNKPLGPSSKSSSNPPKLRGKSSTPGKTPGGSMLGNPVNKENPGGQSTSTFGRPSDTFSDPFDLNDDDIANDPLSTTTFKSPLGKPGADPLGFDDDALGPPNGPPGAKFPGSHTPPNGSGSSLPSLSRGKKPTDISGPPLGPGKQQSFGSASEKPMPNKTGNVNGSPPGPGGP